ncbi:MAG: hypothetical protein M1823_003525 [Watsoniomyces obsoletus]|nr:MAG: hypothetical protein M1823_003525 [Watsoniomyces obsoletus]
MGTSDEKSRPGEKADINKSEKKAPDKTSSDWKTSSKKKTSTAQKTTSEKKRSSDEKHETTKSSEEKRKTSDLKTSDIKSSKPAEGPPPNSRSARMRPGVTYADWDERMGQNIFVRKRREEPAGLVQRVRDRMPRPLPRNPHDWTDGRPPPYYPTYTYRPSASNSSQSETLTSNPSEESEGITVIGSGRYVPPPRGTQPGSSILRGTNTIQLKKNSTTSDGATQTSLSDTPDAGAVTPSGNPDSGSTGATAATEAAYQTYQAMPSYPGMQMPMPVPPPYAGMMPPFNPYAMPPPPVPSGMPPPPYQMPYDGPPPWLPGFNPEMASMASMSTGNLSGTTLGETVIMEPQPAPAPAVGVASAPASAPAPAPAPAVVIPPPPVPAEPVASTVPAPQAVPVAAPFTRVQHVCAGCGKGRSMSYHNQRQLGNNTEPLSDYCARCVKDHTSSEDDETEKEESKKRTKSRRKGSKKRHSRRSRSKHRIVEGSEPTESTVSSDNESEERRRRENSPRRHRRTRSSRHENRDQKPGFRIRISNSPRQATVESEAEYQPEYPTNYADLPGPSRRAYVEPEPAFEDWAYPQEDHAAGGWGDNQEAHYHPHQTNPFMEAEMHQGPTTWEEVQEPPAMMTDAERRMAMHPLPFRHRRPEDVVMTAAHQETAPPIRRVSSPVPRPSSSLPVRQHPHQRHRSDQLQQQHHQVLIPRVDPNGGYHHHQHPIRTERRSRSGIHAQSSNFHDWVSLAAEEVRYYPAEIEAAEDYYRNYTTFPIQPRRHTTTAGGARVQRSASRSETHHHHLHHHHQRREVRDEVLHEARDEQQELARRLRRVQINETRTIPGSSGNAGAVNTTTATATATAARPESRFSVNYKHQHPPQNQIEEDDDLWE